MLSRSHRTIEYHRNRLMRKLNAHNAAELVKLAEALSAVEGEAEGATFHARAALGAFRGFFAQAIILGAKNIRPFLLSYGKEP